MTPSTERLPSNFSNLLLIGMTGCGKTTMGKALAEALELSWIDTDQLLEVSEEKPLHQLLKELGPEGFKAMECRVLSCVHLKRHIISSGGSLVYSQKAMEHFRRSCFVVFLNTPLDVLEPRLGDLEARGTVRKPGQTLASLYEDRMPLYQKYCDLEIETGTMAQKELLGHLRKQIGL